LQNDLSFLEIIENYIKTDRVTLPPFDKTALGIQQELSKTNIQIAKIEKLIIEDPAISTQILKVGNSAFFRGLAKVSTVREAIVRMGLSEITRIVMILTQKKLYETPDTFIKNYRNRLWQHALVCAIVSQWVAKEAGYGEMTQDVFFASLIHDIGKLFLITVIEKIKKNKELPFIPSNKIINEIIDSQHAQQGSRLLKQWNLPEQYVSVVEKHHFEKFEPDNIPLIILRMVNKATAKIGVSLHKYDENSMSLTAEAAFFGFNDIKIAELELQLEEAVKRISTFYKMADLDNK